MSGSKNQEYEMKGALTRYEYINFMGRTAATLFLEKAHAQTSISKEQAKSLLRDSLCFQFWLTTSYINYIFMQQYKYSRGYFVETASTIAKHYHNYYREVTSVEEKTAEQILILMNQAYSHYGEIMDKKLNDTRPAAFDPQITEALAVFFVREIKHKYNIDENQLNIYFTTLLEEALQHTQDKMKKVKKIKEHKTYQLLLLYPVIPAAISSACFNTVSVAGLCMPGG